MPSSREVQAEIQALRADLGIKPPMRTDVKSQIDQLNAELGAMPMSRREYAEKRATDSAMAFSDKASAFGEGVWDGMKILGGQAVDAGGELLDKGFEFEALGDIFYVGRKDFTRFAITLGEAAMDKIGGYSENEEVDREYKRYLENFDYNTKVRPAMLESDEVEYKKITDFGANFVDPFMIFPVAKLGSLAARAPLVAAQKAATAGATALRSKGLVTAAKTFKTADKGISKAVGFVDGVGMVGAYPTEMASRAGAFMLRKGAKGVVGTVGYGLKGIGSVGSLTEKVASAPRRGVAKIASKLKGMSDDVPGAAAFGGQVAGAAGGIPGFLELGIAEGIGIMAKKIGKGVGELATTFAAPGSSKRFLYRLATNEKLSPSTRKMATMAYNMYGTAAGDALFNAVANGLTLGAINSSLAGLAGEDGYASGAAFGSGMLAGAVVPVGPEGFQGGKSIRSRETKTIDSHMKRKLTEDQRTAFKKLPRPVQVFMATLQEANIGAPKFLIMEDDAYLTHLNGTRKETDQELLDRAPKGHFDKKTNTVFLNEKYIKDSGELGVEITAHETGHAFLYEALGNDPAMLQILLEGFKTTEDKGTAFYFQYDKDNNPIGDPIYLNDQAVQIANDYSRKQKGIGVGRNASKLAQEIGADQFAMMFSENPNVFEQFHPRLRRQMLNATRKLFTAIGMAEPVTGNPLKNPISKAQLNSPVLSKLFRNYGKARAVELDQKGDLAKNGMKITPKKGQSGEDRYTELFGGIGLNLRDAKNLSVSNKTLLRELKNLRNMFRDEPRDTWSVTKGGKFVGKNLLSDLRTIFTRNDPFGNVANILDALQEAINQRIGIRFGYRSGTKGKYQNPFRIRDVAIYGWEVSPLSASNSRPTLKVLGYDQAVIRNNIQVLVEKGYIKKPGEFMRQLEDQGQAALSDPEGRINPEGRKENELMTVAFGLKESAGNIASPGLRDLLETGAIKKSFRSYDVEALAGLTKGKTKAFAFGYENIRDNYNPFRQSDDQLFNPSERPVVETGLLVTGGPLSPKPSSKSFRKPQPLAFEDELYTFRNDKGETEKLLPRQADVRSDITGVQISEGGRVYPKQILTGIAKRQAENRLVERLRDNIGNKAGRIWQAISLDDQAFKYPYNITDKNLADIGAKYDLKVDYDSEPDGTGGAFTISDDMGGTIEGYHHKGEITLDSQAAEPSRGTGFGSKAYQAVLDFAHNNDLFYKPSANLSYINKLRTVTAMLSSALKHGTTKHINVTGSQGFTKFELDTFGQNYDIDINTLALREMNLATKRLEKYGKSKKPDLQFDKIGFDFLEGEYFTIGDKGNRVPLDPSRIKALINQLDPTYRSGVGPTTAQRAIITRAAITAVESDKRTGMAKSNSQPEARDGTEAFKRGAFDQLLYIPVDEADLPRLVRTIKQNTDGFTIDLMARFAKAGHVVAPSKATEYVIDQNKLDNKTLGDYLERHAKMFEREGAHLGGWLKDSTGEYMLDVVFPLSYEDAVRHAMWGDQDAIFDLSTFTEIATRDETTKQVKPPEGFPESLDEIFRQKPSDPGASAERSFRDSSPIRDQSIESIRRGAEGSRSEVRESPPPPTRGMEVDDDAFSPSEQADSRFLISTRNPTAGNRTEDPVTSNLVIGLDDIMNAEGFAESYAKAINRYPGFKATRAKPDKVINRFIDMVVDNLLHLHDSMDPEIRDRAKLWYVGARKIAEEYAQKYNMSHQAVAAVMAACSPQTDWYKNVDRARRILEVVVNEQNTLFNDDMINRHIQIASQKDKAKQTALAKTYAGKAFKDLDRMGQAAFIRAFDELYNDRDYAIITPEGDFLGPVLKDNGEKEKYSWLNYLQITKSLSAIADDSKANISNTALGDAHKVRNFFNNILLPFVDTTSVTIDTHAVAAALLRPLASKDTEVYNMLGAKGQEKGSASIKGSSTTGIKGLYGIYAEAYRRAAKARGLLPREMQSITWEAIRGLYPKEIKQPKFKQQINDLFKLYENGKITIDDLRTKIFDKADGIDPPSWFEGGNTAGDNRSRGGFYPQGRRPSIDERELFSPSVRGLGVRTPSRGLRATPNRVSASGVNRFLAPAAVAAGGMELPERFRG